MNIKEKWVSWEEFNLLFPGLTPVSPTDFSSIGGLTPGSIPFANATGFLAQDNANLFWDAAEKNLGIGTNVFGADMERGIQIATGEYPTADVADTFAFYSKDFVADNACPHFRTEDGTEIGLNQSLFTTDSPTFDDLTISNPVNIYALSHDAFADYAANQHRVWEDSIGQDIHADNISEGSVTQHVGAIDHDALLNTHANPYKLDDLAEPDDNTDLDFSTAKHGLCPKGTDVGDFLRDDGTWAPGGGGAATFVALTDTPVNYAGSASKFVKVNATPDALEFASLVKADITDTPWAWGDVSKVGSDLTDLATRQHAGLTDITSDQHHAQLHAASHADAQADELSHDALKDYVVGQHRVWENSIAQDIHADNISEGSVTQHVGAIDHDALLNTHANPYKLDDLATPDDNTDLDFSTTLHGLVPKGTDVGDFLKDDGTWAAIAGGGDVTAGANLTDHSIIRGDGGAKGIQDSGIIVDDSDNVSGMGTLACGELTSIGVTDFKKAAAYYALNLTTFGTDPNVYTHLRLRTSDHDTIDTISETQDGDIIAKLHFQGVDTDPAFEEGAWIVVTQDGAAGGKVPANMVLSTFSDSAENANQLVLYHDGKIGFGIAVPTCRFDVLDQSGANFEIKFVTDQPSGSNCTLHLRGARTTSTTNDIAAIRFEDHSENDRSLAQIAMRKQSASTDQGLLIFRTNDGAGNLVDALVIDKDQKVRLSSGATVSQGARLQIGGDTPIVGGGLQVRSNSAGTYIAVFEQDNSTGWGILVDTDSSSPGDPVFRAERGGSAFFNVGSTGIISATAPSTASSANMFTLATYGALYYKSSSRRIKDKIKDIELDVSKLHGLRPVSFNSIAIDDDKKKRFHGFVAEEVEEIIPELVNYNEDGSVRDYDTVWLQALLVKEVQNLRQEIDGLKSQMPIMINN